MSKLKGKLAFYYEKLDIDRIRSMNESTFYYKNLETNSIESITLKYSSFFRKKVYQEQEGTILDFFVDRADDSSIFVLGCDKDQENPFSIKLLKIEGNNAKVVRKTVFESDSPLLGKLFSAVTLAINGLLLGDHFVFQWKENGEIECFENIFGHDPAKQIVSYNSPIPDNSFRRLCYIVKRPDGFSEAIILPYMNDQRIVFDSKKTKR